ncbi:lamin tail domain-containing protein [Candidatus Margulisiibacteriota bacterium]
MKLFNFLLVGVILITLTGCTQQLKEKEVKPSSNLASPNPGDISINEFLYDPAPDASGDANKDSVINPLEDEFIEIVNISSKKIKLDGCTIEDSGSIRHTFPEETIINPMQAVVIFGGGSLMGSNANELQQLASTGALSLNNTGDTITIKNGETILESLSYTSAIGNNESVNKLPECDPLGTLTPHTSITGNIGTCSPGTLASGDNF